MTRFARKYRRIAKSLTNAELMQGSMDACFDPRALVEGSGSSRFLSFYGDEGLRLALDRYGILSALAERAFRDVCIETSCNDERHTLFIEAPAEDGKRERLVELVARRDRLVHSDPDKGLDRRGPWEVITIEWITLRNPRASFSERRPRLPGQDAPGLGLGENVLELLFRVVERLRLDGLVGVAAHFHLALLYATEMRFIDAAAAGELLALEAALLLRQGLSLAQASWAVEWGLVHREDGSVFEWEGQPQVWPHAEPLVRYLRSSAYTDACAEAAMARTFTLDREAFDARWAAEKSALTGE